MEGVTRTAAGVVRGVRETGVWVFRGIPFARTGPGADRWCPPRPAEPWTGTRDAGAWGAIAPQVAPVPGFSLPDDPTAWNEDCLNLNLWTPRCDDARRPVLVWLHGGGFTTGTGASTLFAGRHLAAKGVVVVTCNYRLGALGLLAHGDLGPGGAGGNWSLLDQIAALAWVRDNAGAFGGDPGNVTLVGESAGAMSIAALLTSPAAAGLFHKAVVQSGPPATAAPAWAAMRTERIAAHVGVPGRTAALRQAPASQLVDATRQLAGEVPTEGGLPLPLLPVVDGRVLPCPPAEGVASGAVARVPLLVGTTRDEAALFTVDDVTDPGLDESVVTRRLARVVGDDAAPEVVSAYGEARARRGESVGGRDLWTAVITDYVFRLPLQVLAADHARHGARTYSYLFTWASPFLDGVFGSSHGLDIPFVFGTVADPAVQTFSGWGPEAELLTEQMQRAWVAFAAEGDPSCDALGGWPSYDDMGRSTMVLGPGGALGPGSMVERDPRAPERGVWEDVGVKILGGHHHE